MGMLKASEYKAHSEALKKSNVVQAKAYVAARKAWNAESEHKGVPFPSKRPVRARCIALKISKNEQSAREYLKKLKALQAKLSQTKLSPAKLSPGKLSPANLGEERESFVVYREMDHAGNISVGMVTVGEYKAHCEALKRPNVLRAEAYVAAENAWNAKTEHKGVPFPLKRPARAECIELKRLEKEQAKEYLDKLEATLATLKAEREKEQNSLAPAELSEAERRKADHHAALLQKAMILFNDKLVELSAKAMAST